MRHCLTCTCEGPKWTAPPQAHNESWLGYVERVLRSYFPPLVRRRATDPETSTPGCSSRKLVDRALALYMDFYKPFTVDLPKYVTSAHHAWADTNIDLERGSPVDSRLLPVGRKETMFSHALLVLRRTGFIRDSGVDAPGLNVKRVRMYELVPPSQYTREEWLPIAAEARKKGNVQTRDITLQFEEVHNVVQDK